jgi:hypothetical protein
MNYRKILLNVSALTNPVIIFLFIAYRISSKPPIRLQ